MTETGVYQIEINGKRYVGGTKKGFKNRWYQHLHDLRIGCHGNYLLQAAYDTYGERSLKFSVLQVANATDDIIALEQHYIDDLNPEYNICKVAGSCAGKKHTDAAKQKVREVRTGCNLTNVTKSKLSEASKNYFEENRKCINERVTEFYKTVNADNLKPKQRQLLLLLKQGETMANAAKRIGITFNYSFVIRRQILKKAGIESTAPKYWRQKK